MGSGESHFNVSLMERGVGVGGGGKVTKTLSLHHSFLRGGGEEVESNRGASAYGPNTLPLGQARIINFFVLFVCLRLQ